MMVVGGAKGGKESGQFCTTPPGGILVGSSSKSVGWIPTVAIPIPDQPPSRFFDSFLFLYQKGNLVNTSKRPLQSSSHKILQFFLDVCRLIFHFICERWDFGGMIDW